MISEEEFVGYMKVDFPQLKMTREDLANPSKQFAINFYCTMLETVTRVHPKLLIRNTEQQERMLQGMTGAGLSDHIAVVNLFKTLKFFFAEMRFQTEFRYSDLIVPFQAPKRSFVFMASFYQFFTHCAAFDEKFAELDRAEEKEQIINKLQQDQAMLKEKLAVQEEKKRQFQARSAEIKKQLAELAEKNDANELKLKELEQERVAQKEKVLTVEKAEQTLQAEYESAENERKHLESLVVSDASEIIEHHSKLSQKKDASFRELRDLEQQVMEKGTKLNQVETILGLHNSLIESLRTEIQFGSKCLDLKDLSIAKSSAKKAIQTLEKEKGEIGDQVSSKQAEKSRLSLKVTSVTSEFDSKNSVHMENMNRLKASVADFQEQLSQFEHKAQIEDADYRDMAQNLKAITEQIVQVGKEIKESDEFNMKRYEEWKAYLIKVSRQMAENALAYQKNQKHGNN